MPCSAKFLMTLQTEILFTETSDIVINDIFLSCPAYFYSLFKSKKKKIEEKKHTLILMSQNITWVKIIYRICHLQKYPTFSKQGYKNTKRGAI